MSAWLDTTWIEVGMALLSLAVTYLAIVAYVRVTGLRSFSKMAAPDFAMTVAVGSLFASIASSSSPSLSLGLIVLGGLFAGQWLFAFVRARWPSSQRVVDNAPLLLMENGEIYERNLAAANVSRLDLFSKLREANVLHLGQVRAVVFETTGDVSVLHSEDTPLAEAILEGVSRGVADRRGDVSFARRADLAQRREPP